MSGSAISEQVDGAYRRMAGFYRPAAPSDGMGNITVPLRELDLEAECGIYAAAWWAEEDTASFHVGFPDMRDRAALVYVIEAARTMCGMKPGTARKLLELALAELEGKEDRRDLRSRLGDQAQVLGPLRDRKRSGCASALTHEHSGEHHRGLERDGFGHRAEMVRLDLETVEPAPRPGVYATLLEFVG